MSHEAMRQDALRTLVELARYFKARHVHEGVELLSAALNAAENQRPTALRAEALGILAQITEGRNRSQHIEEGLEIARSIQDSSLAAELLQNLSFCWFQEQDLERALSASDEALSFAQSVNDSALLGRTLLRRAIVVSQVRTPEEATILMKEALTQFRAVGDKSWEAITLGDLGVIYDRIAGGREIAMAYHEQALTLFRELGDLQEINWELCNIALIAVFLGQLDLAEEYISTALQSNARIGFRGETLYCLLVFACLYFSKNGELERPTRLFGAAERLAAELGLPIDDYEDDFVKTRTQLRASLKGSFDEILRQGEKLSVSAAVELALLKAG
jgi:tetratricopeptide (TPR) repeat protein